MLDDYFTSGGSDASLGDIDTSDLDFSNLSNFVEPEIDFGQAYPGADYSIPEEGGTASVSALSQPSVATIGGSKAAPEGKGSLMNQASRLFTDKAGDLDLSKLIKIGLAIGAVAGNKGRSTGAQSAQQLQAQLLRPNNNWTPQQSMWANQYFNSASPALANRATVQAGAAGQPSSILPSRGYAGGGPLSEEGGVPPPPQGNFGLLDGEGDGTSDGIDIRAARGEFMIPAEIVAMIGNGSNEAGAEKLTAWMNEIRSQKRDAAPEELAPDTQEDLGAYMPGEE